MGLPDPQVVGRGAEGRGAGMEAVVLEIVTPTLLVLHPSDWEGEVSGSDNLLNSLLYIFVCQLFTVLESIFRSRKNFKYREK